VFACAGKTDPPSRLILSQTSAGNRLSDYVIDCSLILCRSFVRAWRSFLRPGLRWFRGAARKGRSRLAVAPGLPLASAFPGHALSGPSTACHSGGVGRHRIPPDAFEVAFLIENGPGDAG
jgi:hypothetical protein